MSLLPPLEPGSAFLEATDESLLQTISEGSEAAFRELYRRHRCQIYATILRILADPEDADEVFQEVMNSVWSKAALYHPGRGRPITWLVSAARNRSIDRLRSRKRQGRLREECALSLDLFQRGTSPVTGSEAATRRETCAAVRQAVLELSSIQREAIEKVYFEGLTQLEVADRLGEPLGTVKARVRRGLAKLREVIGSDR